LEEKLSLTRWLEIILAIVAGDMFCVIGTDTWVSPSHSVSMYLNDIMLAILGLFVLKLYVTLVLTGGEGQDVLAITGEVCKDVERCSAEAENAVSQ